MALKARGSIRNYRSPPRVSGTSIKSSLQALQRGVYPASSSIRQKYLFRSFASLHTSAHATYTPGLFVLLPMLSISAGGRPSSLVMLRIWSYSHCPQDGDAHRPQFTKGISLHGL